MQADARSGLDIPVYRRRDHSWSRPYKPGGVAEAAADSHPEMREEVEQPAKAAFDRFRVGQETRGTGILS